MNSLSWMVSYTFLNVLIRSRCIVSECIQSQQLLGYMGSAYGHTTSMVTGNSPTLTNQGILLF